jgi:hypothetical protein
MTRSLRSSAHHIATLTLAALGAACANDATAPDPVQGDAALAAQTFSHMADSVTQSGGDPQIGGAYGNIASILRIGGRVTPVTISIDGVPTPFVATAMSIESTFAGCTLPACSVSIPSVALRGLVAWAKDDPSRIVQLTSASDDEAIGVIPDPTLLASWAPTATLMYVDGANAVYAGTSGTQHFAVTTLDTPCPLPPDSLARVFVDPIPTCVLADVAVRFSATAGPIPIAIAGNRASGTHTISMIEQTVAGTHREFTFEPCDTGCVVPPSPGAPPPVVFQPSEGLPATLDATIGASVTLTLTVRNPADTAIDVAFPSGQRYDLAVRDSSTGREVWRWSASRTFVLSAQSERIPAGGALTYVERWTPPGKGRYLAHGYLTSTSHRAEAYASVVVP